MLFQLGAITFDCPGPVERGRDQRGFRRRLRREGRRRRPAAPRVHGPVRPQVHPERRAAALLPQPHRHRIRPRRGRDAEGHGRGWRAADPGPGRRHEHGLVADREGVAQEHPAQQPGHRAPDPLQPQPRREPRRGLVGQPLDAPDRSSSHDDRDPHRHRQADAARPALCSGASSARSRALSRPPTTRTRASPTSAPSCRSAPRSPSRCRRRARPSSSRKTIRLFE